MWIVKKITLLGINFLQGIARKTKRRLYDRSRIRPAKKKPQWGEDSGYGAAVQNTLLDDVSDEEVVSKLREYEVITVHNLY